jgi:hypothetical protein
VEPFVAAAGDSLGLITRHYYSDGPASDPRITIAGLLLVQLST